MVFSVTRIDGSAMLRLSRGRELIRRSKYVSLNEVPQHWQVRRSFNTTAVKEQHPRGHTTRAPPVGFELATTNGPTVSSSMPFN